MKCNLLDRGGEDHRRLRKLIAPAFTARRMVARILSGDAASGGHSVVAAGTSAP
jgi:hypothetical protein